MSKPIDLEGSRRARIEAAYREYQEAFEREAQHHSMANCEAKAEAFRKFSDLYLSSDQRDVLGRAREVVRNRLTPPSRGPDLS